MSNIEKLFYDIDKKVRAEQEKSNSNYLKALVNYLSLEDDKDYFDLVDCYSKEDIRKVYNFLVLKSLQELKDINYNITPELIALYIADIAKLVFGDKALNVMDLASGCGNIIIKLLETLHQDSQFISVDADYDYAKLQENIFNLLEREVAIINQDALKKLQFEKQDLVVSDTPIGYYPDEDNALNYKLCSANAYSLNSLLFMEQASRLIADNGLAILVMPKEIMNLDDHIKKFIATDININAFISLPEELFKNKEQARVLVLVTRKYQTILPKQVFLATIPSYQDKKSYLLFKEHIKKWIDSK